MTTLSVPRPRLHRLRQAAARLRADRSGVAMLEFAFTAPIVLGIGCYGVEISNLALVNMRVSQIALNLADNASRVGLATSGGQQMREVDVNDIFAAARYQGQGIKLTTAARITISSLELYQGKPYDTAPVQRIHWQRCIGTATGATYDSQFKSNVAITDGSTAQVANKGYDIPGGISDNGGAVINAPAANTGVMYVEVNYLYKPLFGSWLVQPQRIHYIASFIVRDQRDFSQIFNPSPAATASTCNLYNS